jgi:prepilin-type processing-associated H-X9-DG protein
LELLVTIALIGLLIGFLLAAVQKARGAAQIGQCRNNLRQIGIALNAYHDATGNFPAGVSTDRPGQPMPFAGWGLRLLPYLERESEWRAAVAAFRQDRNFLDIPPHIGLKTVIATYACPSDSRVQHTQLVSESRLERAFSSYLGVNGRGSEYDDGVLYEDSSTRIADISDGTSNTLLAGERPPSADLIFGWWYAGWGQNKDGEGDMVLGVRTRNSSMWGDGCPNGPYDFKAGDFKNQCDAFHFWSPHPGGANFLLCDGSVRFLPYSANAILPALATRAGGEAAELP